MAYTKHGHHIPGTSVENKPDNPARCGGPNFCSWCSREAVANVMSGSSVETEILFGDNTANYQTKAMDLVREYIGDAVPPFRIPAYEIYVVWFAKTLQNWKALVSTNRQDDMYYEVTYNGDKKETYLDVYMKAHNRVIPD